MPALASTSRPSCRGTRRASSTSACCTTATGASATRGSYEARGMTSPKTASGRLGRYDNPWLVAEWHRDPPAGNHLHAAPAPDRGPRRRPRLALRARRRTQRRVPDASRARISRGTTCARARRGRLRRLLHQQPLARQRLDADPRGGAARRRGGPARRAAPLRPRGAARELGGRLALHVLPESGARAGRRAPGGHRGRRPLRPEPLRAARARTR